MNNELMNVLKDNKIAVVRTDTLYGILGRANQPDVVQRVYDLKGRDSDKPFIILLSSIGEIQDFGVSLSDQIKNLAAEYWPGPVTLIFELSDRLDEFEYLHRGKKSLAFRIPDDSYLVHLIKQVGPLVAPSANRQGQEPARNILQAREYFENGVDYYDDRGEIKNAKASSIIKIQQDKFKFLRN